MVEFCDGSTRTPHVAYWTDEELPNYSWESKPAPPENVNEMVFSIIINLEV
jgi:hypothetical protein